MSQKILSNEQEQQLVQEYLNGESVTNLQKKYGYKTKKSILDKVKKHFGRVLTEEEKQQIINKRKNYSVDFSKIDSPFNAYFIGLMYTDGYVCDDNKFGIDLVDEDAIKFISEITGKKYSHYEEKDKQDRFRIIFSDKNQIENLKRYHITKRKTFTIKGFDFTEEEEIYLPYLVRGIIDGDGCIYTTSYGKPAFYISSKSEEFMNWIAYILSHRFYMKDIQVNKTQDDMWKVETAQEDNINILRILIYNKPYGMARKYNKLRETLNDYNRSIQ